jgi:hypothetical protein
MAFWGRDANEIERAQLSIMARGSKAPSIGRIQKRKTNFSKSSLSACNAPAGPYRWANRVILQCRKTASLFAPAHEGPHRLAD